MRLLLALTLSLVLHASANAAPCDSLATLHLTNATITSAHIVAAGTFRLPRRGPRPSVEMFTAYDRLPAFCRVQATATPSPDSHIEIEVWLPTTGWNGRYLGVGNGGYAGSISYPRLGEAINSGYSTR